MLRDQSNVQDESDSLDESESSRPESSSDKSDSSRQERFFETIAVLIAESDGGREKQWFDVRREAWVKKRCLMLEVMLARCEVRICREHNLKMILPRDRLQRFQTILSRSMAHAVQNVRWHWQRAAMFGEKRDDLIWEEKLESERDIWNEDIVGNRLFRIDDWCEEEGSKGVSAW